MGTKMTDLEMTRLCASAMGEGIEIDGLGGSGKPYHIAGRRPYDPFHDDAQAMALVKKFGLSCSFYLEEEGKNQVWSTEYFDVKGNHIDIENINLNRAIVECVAKMEKAKHG